MSFFEAVEFAPEDPIMNLPFLFEADQRSHKVNLGIGSYHTVQGKPFVLSCVRKAEEMLIQKKEHKEYLPIEGCHTFIEESLKLIFGVSFDRNLIHGVQAVGGTSALRLGAEFLIHETSKLIFIPNFTWLNHEPLFQSSGFKVEHYPYYDTRKNSVDFEGIKHAISGMPPGSILLLHACCHNPTGADLTLDQWKELSALIKEQRIFPFFDLSYQGFGVNLEQDVKPIRYFVEQGHECFVAASYSKNLGLYGERIGLLAVVNHQMQVSQKVISQIKRLIRVTYSNPPCHGAHIVSTVLTSPILKKEWEDELDNIRQRMQEMRAMFAAGFQSRCEEHSFSYVTRQVGFFSLAGLDKDQVHKLRLEKGVYLPYNGRMNFAGLNPDNIDYVIDAFISVIGTYAGRH